MRVRDKGLSEKVCNVDMFAVGKRFSSLEKLKHSLRAVQYTIPASAKRSAKL